jgi:hypothetical protein
MVAASFAEADKADMAKELLTAGCKTKENVKNSLHNKKNERRKK